MVGQHKFDHGSPHGIRYLSAVHTNTISQFTWYHMAIILSPQRMRHADPAPLPPNSGVALSPFPAELVEYRAFISRKLLSHSIGLRYGKSGIWVPHRYKGNHLIW